MPEILLENVKEIIEVPENQANAYQALGWLEIDNYRNGGKVFLVLAWTEDSDPRKP
ncbi:hypothetical protein EDC14_10712 [Hydrogenispora ethanolica]|jgi:hypothetical protein|uniref:Uncharacterized protein n=1 Tax=Hydrogenispora ethanolica TaxID=1082276 RepID=A0A4V2QAU3_HYDET|nr:hypothetical protein [Hydrogenispora ethanolica]TCL53802.1 hypothetical protein EDC14_10712 [Hydrogenispora ethanolica]